MEYLIGCLILGLIWSICYAYRKDLRRPMVWSGIAYICILTIMFIALKILLHAGLISYSVVPDYWNPDTMLDMGRITGGYAIEDAIFMFLVGGIVTTVYDILISKRIQMKHTRKHHLRAPAIALVGSIAVTAVFDLNPIYTLMIFGMLGSISIWIERHDLVIHSVFGGFSFTVVYFLAFVVFNWIFPDFIHTFYRLGNISGIFLYTVPLEELLFALSFGLMWAPIYEYEHGLKNA